MERETGLEPAALCLGSRCATIAPFPRGKALSRVWLLPNLVVSVGYDRKLFSPPSQAPNRIFSALHCVHVPSTYLYSACQRRRACVRMHVCYDVGGSVRQFVRERQSTAAQVQTSRCPDTGTNCVHIERTRINISAAAQPVPMGTACVGGENQSNCTRDCCTLRLVS